MASRAAATEPPPRDGQWPSCAYVKGARTRCAALEKRRGREPSSSLHHCLATAKVAERVLAPEVSPNLGVVSMVAKASAGAVPPVTLSSESGSSRKSHPHAWPVASLSEEAAAPLPLGTLLPDGKPVRGAEASMPLRAMLGPSPTGWGCRDVGVLRVLDRSRPPIESMVRAEELQASPRKQLLSIHGLIRNRGRPPVSAPLNFHRRINPVRGYRRCYSPRWWGAAADLPAHWVSPRSGIN